jgi:hypothetical protein
VNELSRSTLALDACPCFLCPIEDRCLALKHHNGCSYIEQWALIGISNAKAGLVEKVKESHSNEKGKTKAKSKGKDFENVKRLRKATATKKVKPKPKVKVKISKNKNKHKLKHKNKK